MIITQTHGNVNRLKGGFARFSKKFAKKTNFPFAAHAYARNEQNTVSAIKNAKLNAENIARYFPAFSG